MVLDFLARNLCKSAQSQFTKQCHISASPGFLHFYFVIWLEIARFKKVSDDKNDVLLRLINITQVNLLGRSTRL